MSPTGVLRKVGARSWAERALAIEAAALLLIARVAVRLVAFRHIVRVLRLDQGETSSTTDARACERAARIGWAIRAATAHTPWGGTCLMQGIAGVAMLRRRRVPATLYLGVAKDTTSTSGLAAHAWLRSGGTTLTGAGNQSRFTVVGTYST